MAEGFGVRTSDKTLNLAIAGGLALVGYTLYKGIKGIGDVGQNVGKTFDFTDPSNWLNRIFQSSGEQLGHFGDTLGDVGHFIDLTDARKYDWLSGSHGILANTGNWLGDVGSFIDVTDDFARAGDQLGGFGSSIDVTDPNSNLRKGWDWLTPW